MSWSALRSARSVDERRSYIFLEDGVEMGKECVPTWVNVNGGLEGLDENGFLDASFDPVLLTGKDGNVILTEMMLIFLCVFKHGGFVHPKCVVGCRRVFVETRS